MEKLRGLCNEYVEFDRQSKDLADEINRAIEEGDIWE